MYQVILVVRWYLVVQAFALAGLPLCLCLFRHLPDRGYSVSKPFALVVTGWIFWLLGTLGWVHNTAGGIVGALSAGLLLLPSLGAPVSLALLAALNAAAGLLLFASLRRPPWRTAVAAALVAREQTVSVFSVPPPD